MKTIITSVLVLIVALGSQAQDYKKFRVGLGLGYARPAGDGAKGGVLLSLEPGYRVNDQLLVQLRLETALVARVSADGSAAEVKGLGSYTVNGQYYLNNESFRPFFGLGFGLFSMASSAASITSGGGGSVSATVDNKIGLYPRIGFDLGHFTMSLDYNLVPKSTQTFIFSDNQSNALIIGKKEIPNSYLGLRLGFFIGGGKK